jgi:hypothetical protein
MKERRGRWNPSPAQISLAIDCATARMPLEKAAVLLNIKPRSLWIFARRIDLPGIFGIWRDRPRYKPAHAAISNALKPVLPASGDGPVHPGIPAQEGGS